MRALSGTWLQPSAFFALWWSFFGIVPLVLAPNEHVGPHAMLWIIAAAVSVSLGATAGNLGFRTRVASRPATATDREVFVIGTLVLWSVLLGIGSNIVFVMSSNVAWGDLLNIEKLVIVSNQLYAQRFGDTPPAPPMLSQLLLPFVYLAPALGGILFVIRREKRWKLVALLAFAPAVAFTILQTTKAAVLFAMVFWLAGYFAARLRFGRLSVFTKRHVLVAAGVSVVLAVFFLAVSLARLASTDAALLDLVVRKLFSAVFGHMTVFSQYLEMYWNQPFEPSLGTTVLAGPLEILGFGHRIPGIFENSLELLVGETSNVYTGFRPLIDDFGLAGALGILVLLGVIGGVGFRLVAAGRWSGAPLLLVAYYTTMLSPITWLWVYNSATATLFTVAVIVVGIRVWRGITRIPVASGGSAAAS